MVLGQTVAISVASSLFYLAVAYRTVKPIPIPSKKDDDNVNAVLPPTANETEAPAQLTISVLLALLLVSITPPTESPNFLPNLLAFHGLIIVPLLPPFLQTDFPKALKIPVSSVYFAIIALALVFRLQSTIAALASLPEASLGGLISGLVDTLHSHPAQASIGWDVIWTTVAFGTWHLLGDGTQDTPVESLMPTLSAFMALGVAFAAPMSLGNVIEELFGARQDETVNTLTQEEKKKS